MSNSNQESGGIRFDDFVSKIVSDPAKPAAHTVLKGFIGRSSEPEHVRVYFDEALSNFIDIPEKAITYTSELNNSPLGGSTIWVKAGTEYTYGDPAAEKRSKNKFFDGPVYQDYVTNVKPPEADASISFQYCISTACSDICSGNCITFQYCISRICTQAPVEEAFNTNTPQGSISFQYCISTACSNICSGNCITFQYCITRKCTQPPVEEWRYAGTNQGYGNFNAGAGRFNPNQFNAGGFNANPGAAAYSISYQYCATQDTACPTQSANCSELCPSFQYCPSGGGDCPSLSSNCKPQVVPNGYQNPAFRNGGFNNQPTLTCGFNGNFNPYRGY